MNEDIVSIGIVKLNEERIRYKYIADRKNRIICILNNLKWLIKYITAGDFRYFYFRVKDKLFHNNNNTDDSQETVREITKNDRIAVFTVLFGKYDTLRDPVYVSPNCDYFVFTNAECIESKVWRKFDVESKIGEYYKKFSNLELARYCKTHPHLFFNEYKYSVFVDANIQIVGDMRPVVARLGTNFIAIHKQPGRSCVYQEATEVIVRKKANPKEVKTQMKEYREAGFPREYGMFQTNVVVREHNLDKCVELMETWWQEMEKHTKRDQLSFTYSLWKNRLSKKDVSVLGENTDLNPRFNITSHL